MAIELEDADRGQRAHDAQELMRQHAARLRERGNGGGALRRDAVGEAKVCGKAYDSRHLKAADEQIERQAVIFRFGHARPAPWARRQNDIGSRRQRHGTRGDAALRPGRVDDIPRMDEAQRRSAQGTSDSGVRRHESADVCERIQSEPAPNDHPLTLMVRSRAVAREGEGGASRTTRPGRFVEFNSTGHILRDARLRKGYAGLLRMRRKVKRVKLYGLASSRRRRPAAP